MSDKPSQTDGLQPGRKPISIYWTIFLVLFATPFAGLGLVAFIEGIGKLIARDSEGPKAFILGLVFMVIGFGLMIGAIKARKNSIKSAAIVKRFPDKPWMLREDWAQGKVKSSILEDSMVALVIGLALCGLGALGTVKIVLPQLQEKNYVALFILIFPLVGIGLLFAFVSGLRSRIHYGNCFLELAQVPIPAGGTLEGMIETGTRFKVQRGLQLKLSCIRRVVTQFEKSSSTSVHVLWQEEKNYKSGAELPEPEPGHTGIPVHFKLPAGKPPCSDEGNVSVTWQLEAEARMDGPNFSATFELPVFDVDGAAASELDGPDPTAALQASSADAQRDPQSKIKVTQVPGGQEFYFPAARNAKLNVIITVMFAVASGISALLLHPGVPLWLKIIWGIINVLIGMACFNAWFKSIRVTVDATGVRVVYRFLIVNRTRQFAAAAIGRIEATTGLRTRSQDYSDIQIFPPAPRATDGKPANEPAGVIVVNAIAGDAEANWLAQQMRRSLGRSAGK